MLILLSETGNGIANPHAIIGRITGLVDGAQVLVGATNLGSRQALRQPCEIRACASDQTKSKLSQGSVLHVRETYWKLAKIDKRTYERAFARGGSVPLRGTKNEVLKEQTGFAIIPSSVFHVK